MRVYVAGSFKNQTAIREIGNKLRAKGHQCYVFCDEHEFTYTLSQELRRDPQLATLTPQAIEKNATLIAIGHRNWMQLKVCDVLVLVLPCGRSAHLEAGWMVGKNRRVYVIGPMRPNEFDAMYVMVDGIFSESQFEEMATQMQERWELDERERR